MKICWTTIGFYKPWVPTMKTRFPCCYLVIGDRGRTARCSFFNNVPSGKADDPQYRNPRQSGNVRLAIDFAVAVNHNITVLVWSEYENVYEINHLGGIKYNTNG